MKASRKTQPYRASGSRAASPVLDRMQAGRSFGLNNALVQAAGSPSKGKRVLVPRIPPAHRRRV